MRHLVQMTIKFLISCCKTTTKDHIFTCLAREGHDIEWLLDHPETTHPHVNYFFVCFLLTPPALPEALRVRFHMRSTYPSCSPAFKWVTYRKSIKHASPHPGPPRFCWCDHVFYFFIFCWQVNKRKRQYCLVHKVTPPFYCHNTCPATS